MLQLPEEIILHIVSFITNTKLYYNLRLTCRYFYYLLSIVKIFKNNKLYKAIHFQDTIYNIYLSSNNHSILAVIRVFYLSVLSFLKILFINKKSSSSILYICKKQ